MKYFLTLSLSLFLSSFSFASNDRICGVVEAIDLDHWPSQVGYMQDPFTIIDMKTSDGKNVKLLDLGLMRGNSNLYCVDKIDIPTQLTMRSITEGSEICYFIEEPSYDLSLVPSKYKDVIHIDMYHVGNPKAQ